MNVKTGKLKAGIAAAVGAVVIGATGVAVGAYAGVAANDGAADGTVQEAAPDIDTIELASSDLLDSVPGGAEVEGAPVQGAGAGAKDGRGIRARMLRALHGTWVTQGKNGTVTHQAIRGEVTAVSATSITIKAKDGVSMTFVIGPDTTVRERPQGTGKAKGKDSTIGEVKVGAKALVAGVGATGPTGRFVVFRA
jgi:hypothetical protein